MLRSQGLQDGIGDALPLAELLLEGDGLPVQAMAILNQALALGKELFLLTQHVVQDHLLLDGHFQLLLDPLQLVLQLVVAVLRQVLLHVDHVFNIDRQGKGQG